MNTATIVSAHDVAAFILEQHGQMSAMKLQKLVYYSQAWSLVWDEAPLFHDAIEAWANGPVVSNLYRAHRGKFVVSRTDFPAGDPTKLNGTQRDTVFGVLRFYGDKTPEWLSDLTHAERPWQQARVGLQPGQRGEQTITPESMYAYYSTLG